MKRSILIFTLLIAFVVGASAQFTTGVKMAQTTSDSIKTGALTVDKVLPILGGYNVVSIQPVVTKVSGTIAGTVTVLVSVDGTNYIATGDTLTLSNKTINTTIFKYVGNPYWKYKIHAVGSGTMNGVLTVWYVCRKHE